MRCSNISMYLTFEAFVKLDLPSRERWRYSHLSLYVGFERIEEHLSRAMYHTP